MKKQEMSGGAGSSVAVHVHYHLARGGYTGDYDFWTLVVQHPVLSSMTAAFLYDLTKILARKTITLLKGAATRAKRVDLMIPFRSQSWVVVRVIGSPPPGEVGEGIPSESEVHGALTWATASLQEATAQAPQEPVAVTAELHIRTGPVRLQVETTIGPRQWPAFEEQVAMAISEKPTLLEATDAKEGIQGSGTRGRKKSEKEKGRAARGAKAMGKKKEGKKRKKKK